VFILNIYHIKGTDCGQQFVFQTNNQSQKFQSLYRPCFLKQLSSVKTGRVIKLKNPRPATIAKPKEVLQSAQVAKATYVVWDSLKHSVIETEVNWTKKSKSSYTMEKGMGEIILERNKVYNVSFSALGYRSKTVSFITGDSLSSTTRYIFLTPVKEGENFTMDKIYFYPNTYALKPGAQAEVDKLLKYLLRNPEIKVEIQGYTNGNNRIKASPDDFTEGSFTGSSKKLSKFRAETIKKYLVEKGIAEDRLITNGYGGSDMIFPNPRNQEEADRNIRVGVLILPQKEAMATAQRK
jgi:outer membrane protein OmpA-like peptidoglycan-associated protein